VAAITPQHLLSVWEEGVQRHPIDRALLLLSLARPETPAEQLADLPLGARNAALMSLQRACFSARLPAWLDCLACGERMEFELDAAQLPPTGTERVDSIEVDGHRFTCPTSRHLAKLARRNDEPQTAARQLLLDCAQDADALPRDQAALAELLQHIESTLEAVDPGSTSHSMCVVRPARRQRLLISISPTTCGVRSSSVRGSCSAIFTPWRKPMDGPNPTFSRSAKRVGLPTSPGCWRERPVPAPRLPGHRPGA